MDPEINVDSAGQQPDEAILCNSVGVPRAISKVP